MKSPWIRAMLTGRSPREIAWAVARIYVLFGMLLVLAMQLAENSKGGMSLQLLWANVSQASILILGSSVAIWFVVRDTSKDVFQLHEDIIDSQMEILRRLTIASEFRDGATRTHTYRVGQYSEEIALELGFEPIRAKMINLAAQLHDVGKVGIPDAILLKPGTLDDSERKVMQQHVAIGGRLLADGHTELMEMCESVVWGHHERWDGTGYPNELRSDEIPIEARIASVADVFDALCSARPYKESWSMDDAAREILQASGTQFDPEVVEAFERALPKLKFIAAKITDAERPDLEVLPTDTRDAVKAAMLRAS